MDQTLDPQVQQLTQAIAMQEGGGKLLGYNNPSGDEPNAPTGTAGGRYQFTADTWKNYAGQVLGDANAPMTPDNQNQVAYTKLKQWKDSGKTWAQMASMWNAGENAPDAWKPGTQQKVGDTPDYVKNVQKYAQQIASGQPNQSTQGGVQGYAPPVAQGQQQSGGNVPGYAPPTPPVQTPDTSQGGTTGGALVQPESLWQKAGDVAKGVGNFLFPAVGDVSNLIQGKNTKTPLQIAGDVGLSALPFIPGLGEVGMGAKAAEAGVEGAGALAEGGGLLSKIAGLPAAVKGAGVGYGAGVASNLSQGQGLGQAFMPNAATIGGAVLGGAAPLLLKGASALGTKFSGIDPQVQTELTRMGSQANPEDVNLYDKYISATKAHASDLTAKSPLTMAADNLDNAAL